MNTFFRILKYSKPVGLLAPQYLFFIILHAILNVVNLVSLIPVLEVIFGTVENTIAAKPDFSLSIEYFKSLFYYHFHGRVAQNGPLNALYFVCLIVVTATMLSNVFRYVAILTLEKVRINVTNNLRNDFAHKLLQLDMQFFTTGKRGDIIARGTSDLQQVEATVVSTFTVLFKDPFLIFTYFFVLLRMNAELTLYTLLLLPLSGLVISRIVRRLRKTTVRLQDKLGEIGNTLDETIGGMRVIKAFAASKFIRTRFKNRIDEYAKLSFKVSKSYNLAQPISEIFGYVTLSLLMLVGGQMILQQDSSLSAQEFIVFLIIFSQILNPAKAISNAISTINKGLASGERVFDLMDTQKSISNKANAIGYEGLAEKIAFKDVSFAYDEKPILKDVSFEIAKGEVVALVGPSGGGKSTIADLLPRFYDPIKGCIELDGTDLKDYHITSLRDGMGIVTQESILFHDSVFNNIAFGMEDASLEEVIEAAKVANAHEFISKLEEGYDTIIGERGSKLSGGQRQRLSIARAVLKNPPILILDEATSALDSESEKLVQDAIFNLMRNRTVLVIAHRLSTIKEANQILVVKDGAIIQKGKHEELIREGGLYKKLTEMQSF